MLKLMNKRKLPGFTLNSQKNLLEYSEIYGVSGF